MLGCAGSYWAFHPLLLQQPWPQLPWRAVSVSAEHPVPWHTGKVLIICLGCEPPCLKGNCGWGGSRERTATASPACRLSLAHLAAPEFRVGCQVHFPGSCKAPATVFYFRPNERPWSAFGRSVCSVPGVGSRGTGIPPSALGAEPELPCSSQSFVQG